MFFSLNYPPISNTTNMNKFMFPRTINNRHVKQAQPLQRHQSQHLQQYQQITNSIQHIAPRSNTTSRFNIGNMNSIFASRGRPCG